jgi:hypothetical protein
MIDYRGPCLDCNLPGDDDLPEGITDEEAVDLATEAAIEREADRREAADFRESERHG